MGLVLTDDSHYKAIADTIRDRGGDLVVEVFEKDIFTSSEMADAVGVACDANYSEGMADGIDEGYSEGYSTGYAEGYEEGHPEGYAEGYDAGITEGAEICAAKHFVHNFVGNGGTSYSIHIPFEPDVVCITGLDPTCVKKSYQLAVVMCDTRAFGMLGGFMEYGDAGSSSGIANAVYTTTSMLTRYSRTADGTVTIANIGPSDKTVTYGAGVPYTLIALKYAEQTDKERITDFVGRLTGSGSVTLNKAKVNAAFSDAEWSALVATKPNWTFAFI